MPFSLSASLVKMSNMPHHFLLSFLCCVPNSWASAKSDFQCLTFRLLCCQVRCVNCSSPPLFVLLKASLQIRPINRMQCSKGRRLDPFKTLLLDMRKTQWLPFCLHSCCQLTCIYCPISQRLRSKFSSVLGHPVTLAKITKEKSGRMSLQNWVTIGPQFHYLSSLSTCTPHSKHI